MRHIYSNNSSAKLILIQHIRMDVITGHLDIKSIHFVFKPTSPMSCVMKCIQRGDIQKNGQKMCAICLPFGRIVLCFITSQKIEKVFLQRALFQGQRRFDSGTNPKASRIYIDSPSLTMLKEDLPSTHIKPLSIRVYPPIETCDHFC